MWMLQNTSLSISVRSLSAVNSSIPPFSNVEFRKIETNQYKLSQAADLICTVEAIAQKTILTKSESEFFHSKNEFRKNIYKNIAKKKL